MPAPRQLYEKFKFTVWIDGFTSAAFSKCSELSFEMEKIEYREGGSVIPIKDPGLVSFTDVTLERGAARDEDFYAWILEVIDVSAAGAVAGAAGSGFPSPTFKRNLSIKQHDRDNSVLRTWNLFSAFPTKFVAGDWDNSANEVVIEQLTLTYDFFQPELS